MLEASCAEAASADTPSSTCLACLMTALSLGTPDLDGESLLMITRGASREHSGAGSLPEPPVPGLWWFAARGQRHAPINARPAGKGLRATMPAHADQGRAPYLVPP